MGGARRNIIRIEILFSARLGERIWHRENDTRAGWGGFWPVDLYGVLELKRGFSRVQDVHVRLDFCCCIIVCFIGVILFKR